MTLSVLLVRRFGVFFPISVLGLSKERKAVKARSSCPPFLLMINVWLSSEEKCFVSRALKENYLEALSIFESCRHGDSMWWQSHNVCPTCTCVYLRQPSSPTGWTKKALKGRFLTWKHSLAKSKGQEMKLWWCCHSAACWAALGVGELCLLKHGGTEKIEASTWNLTFTYFLFFISSKLVIELHKSGVSTEPSLRQLHSFPTAKRILWQSLLFDFSS